MLALNATSAASAASALFATRPSARLPSASNAACASETANNAASVTAQRGYRQVSTQFHGLCLYLFKLEFKLGAVLGGNYIARSYQLTRRMPLILVTASVVAVTDQGPSITRPWTSAKSDKTVVFISAIYAWCVYHPRLCAKEELAPPAIISIAKKIRKM